MKYILNQEELDDLNKKISDKESLPSRDMLQKFCTNLADTMVLTSGWAKGEPWGCIITIQAEGGEHWCDECPARSICPSGRKKWSK